VKEQRGELTDDDLDRIEGRPGQVAGRCGMGKEDVDDWMAAHDPMPTPRPVDPAAAVGEPVREPGDTAILVRRLAIGCAAHREPRGVTVAMVRAR
jgi:hypothetical protein